MAPAKVFQSIGLHEAARAEQQHLAHQDRQEADVDRIAYVAVEPAHHKTRRRSHRHGSPLGLDELDKRQNQWDEAPADEQPSRCLRDCPVRQGPVNMPSVQQIRKQAGEDSPDRHAPRHADDQRY
jgi:hypothetical protein